MGFFQKSRQSIIRFVHKSIIDLWVAPLDRIATHLEEGKQSPQKIRLTWCANVGRVLVMNLRLNIKRWAGENWSAVYIGDGLSTKVIKHYLFPSPPQEEELGKIFLWQIPGLIRKYSQGGDLLVFELNEMIHYKFMDKGFFFASPPWVKQILEKIDRPIEEILMDMNQAMRRHIRKLDAQGFSYVLTKNPDDFDMFFHRMYLPYITKRFGELDAIFEDYDHMLNRFQMGGLVLIKQNETPVCGMVCIWGEDWCSALQMGVLDGEFNLVKQGSNVALWWYTLDWARKLGAKRVDFGGSRSLTADGVFNFKRQYGARVRKDINQHSRWFINSPSPTDGLRDYLNKLGFVHMEGNEGFRVVLPEPGAPLGKEHFSSALAEAENYGLAGLLVVTEGERTLIRN
jgi:hypothetical protein